MGNQQNKVVRTAMFVVFVGMGIIAELTPLHLIFNLQFVFTAVFYLVLLQLFGYRQAVVAVILIHGASYIGDSFQWLPFLLALGEVTFISIFLRWKGKSIILWDLLYWAIVWPVVTFTLYSFETFEFFIVALLLGFVNALIAVLLAEVLSILFGRQLKPLYFGKIITLIIYLSAVLPLYGVTLYNSVFIERSMINQVKSNLEVTANRVEERLSTIDETELLNLQHGSVVQKAYLASMFDYITAQSDLEIYVVNDQHELYMVSGTDKAVEEQFTVFNDGYVGQVDQEEALFVWLPKEDNSLLDWAEGYYFKTVEASNLHIFSMLPLKGLLITNVSVFTNYYYAILLVFLVAVCIAFICKTILSKSLSHLTNLTSNLPKRMEQQDEFVSERSNIHEFRLLSENFEVAANKLRQMFQEGNRRNNLLIKRTEQLTHSKQQLEYLARYDELTGLLNRRSFQHDVAELLEQCKQNDEQFALLFMDLDQFKEVNDLLGHSGGDELLKCYARRLQAFIAQTDRMTAYRFGGDEFIITIKNPDVQHIPALCKQLVAELSQPTELLGTTYTISQSIGVSLFPQDGDEVDELIRYADQAMYRVKQSGKDGFEFYDRKVDTR